MTTQASSRNRPGSYVFDRFRLSADGTLLREQDAAVAVAPKVLRTLLVLVVRAGEVVTKEDLLQAVWPDSFVEDTGLTRNISLLRQALGDDGQQFIVIVPRIVYRFVAPVERIEAPATSPRTDGMLSVHTGRVDEGLDELSSGIESSRRIMGQVGMPQFSTMIAEVLLLRGDVTAAKRRLGQALELSDRQFDRYFAAELHRLSAACSSAQGERAAARAHLREALEIAPQGAVTFELRAALALATQEPSEGLRAVQAALTAYPEPQPWPDITAARKILDANPRPSG